MVKVNDVLGLDVPTGLTRKGRKAAFLIRRFCIDHDLVNNEKLFCTPREWTGRGEDYGQGAVLILIHECCEAGEALSHDKAYDAPRPYHLLNELTKKLRDEGFFMEEMYRWAAAVYEN